MRTLRHRTIGEMRRLGLRPRRSLGQSFLVDPGVARRIVTAAEAGGRPLLEIGPGLGALTGLLAAEASRLTLIEIDERMAERLRAEFAGRENVRVVRGDALTVPFDRLLPEAEPTVVVANLPYRVASRVLVRLVEERRRFPRLVVMLQKEVAERLVARPGTRAYGVLTLLVGLYGEASILFRVPPSAFAPRPKVESALVSIDLASEPRVALRDAARFREIVRASFGQRRKTLRNALSRLATAADLERAGIDPGRRGETLSLEEFAQLADRLPRRTSP